MNNIQTKCKEILRGALNGDEKPSKTLQTARTATADANSAEEGAIVDWLAELPILNRAPLHYVIPRAELLAEESIHFFYIDNNWITALIDGAFSIGRSTSSDQWHDGLVGDDISAKAILKSQKTRNSHLGTDDKKSTAKIVTGFILRSALAGDYPGLEANGYEAAPPAGTELPILRMERLSPNILLCFFSGELKYLTLHLPPEGIFFGFDIDLTTKEIYKSLRIPESTGNKNDIGKTISGTKIPNKDIPFRNKEKNVLNVSKLSGKIKSALKKQNYTVENFGSADFALQMVEGIEEIIMETKVESD